MKTAVSIPDDVPDEITESMNRVCDAVGDQDTAFVEAASRRVLENVEW